MSVELISRGANNVVSVDRDGKNIANQKAMKKEKNLENWQILTADVFKMLENTEDTYDIIFADPPYGMAQKEFEKIVALIFENELLDEEGMLVVEHSKYTKLESMPNYSFQKNYGGSVFTFFEFESDDDSEGEE